VTSSELLVMPLKLAFFGTAAFSVPTLLSLLDAGHEIVAAYTQPPKPAGRGHHMKASPVHELAEARGVPVRTPKSLKSPEEHQQFAELGVDAGVVVAYGLILPGAILYKPALGCMNVHASLLPRWRGAAPIHRAILAGDGETGVTIMQMDEGLDTGPALLSDRISISAHTTASELQDALAALGARLLLPALEGVRSGTLTPKPQPTEGVTYAHKLTRDEGAIDWTRPATEVERMVRALNPWPGVWFLHGTERIRVLKADVSSDNGPPGTVLDDRLTIACGKHALEVHEVQRAGKSPMRTDAFLRGFPIGAGTQLK